MKLIKQLKAAGTPIAEIEIDRALVFNLLAQQHRDLMYLPIKFFDAGWDNVIFRLGNRLCVRLPRRQAAAKLIENEQIWLPQIADRLTIPVPVPYRIGQSTSNYPWGWSILPWLSGVSADLEKPNANQAKLFGSFLKLLHQNAPLNAPSNPFRGISLRQKAADIEQRIKRLEQKTADIEQRIKRLEQKTNLITQKIKDIWYEALDTPIDMGAKLLHGDLHPGNILVKKGAIAGVIDWGDITSGDVATDLASIWMLFGDQNIRKKAIAEYGDISIQTLQRAKGWAIYFGITLLDLGLIDNQRQAITGKQILCRIVADI